MTHFPPRIQLRRSKGWRKPAGAIVVARPTCWGNPFWTGAGSRREAARKFRAALGQELARLRALRPAADPYFRRIAETLPSLRGHALGCWCAESLPFGDCHADVLIELANTPDQTDSGKTDAPHSPPPRQK